MASNILNNFAWAKLVYSALIIGGIVLLVSELGHLWFDKKLHIGVFQYFEGGEEKPAQGKAFALQVVNQHRLLVHLLSSQAERRLGNESEAQGGSGISAASVLPNTERSRPTEEKTWWPREVLPVADPKSALSDIELSVQGINVKQILNKLREWISAPNEVYGALEKQGSLITGIAIWPRGPSRAQGSNVDGQFLEIDGHADTSSAAFYIACSLVWAQAAVHQQDLADTPRRDFCNWAFAWSRAIGMRSKAASYAGLEKADVDTLKQLRIFLTRMIERGASYPEIYRLRADLIDLLPSAEKTDDDLASAQSDRTYYAVFTDPEKRKLPAEIAALIALAEARPAIPLADGKLRNVPSETWRSVLYPHMPQILAAARATGFGRLYRKGMDEPDLYFNGFAIAPKVIATVGFAFAETDRFKRGSFPRPLDRDLAAYFSFSDKFSKDRPSDAVDIEEILYFFEGTDAGTSFALFKLKEHDIAAHPPLTFDSAGSAASASIGRYVFTVGYPAFDARNPAPFTEALLGNEGHVKRLMPGRIVQIGNQDNSTTASEELPLRMITSDLSTMGGTAGGPLVDLRTGKVLGLHFGGRWKAGKGKFAYATMFSDLMSGNTIPANVRHAIEKRQPP